MDIGLCVCTASNHLYLPDTSVVCSIEAREVFFAFVLSCNVITHLVCCR